MNVWLNDTLKRYSVWIALTAILSLSAYLRFRALGYASMIADVMEYYKIATAKVSPLSLMVNPVSYGLTGLWGAAHNLFFLVLPVEISFHNIRIVDAFAGVLSVFVLFCMARRIGGRGIGLLSAFFLAIHPVHIQMSRESYAYVAVVLGVLLILLGVLDLLESKGKRTSPPWTFYFHAIFGFGLTTMNVASWPYAFAAVVALMAIFTLALRKGDMSWKSPLALLLAFVVISLPILLNTESVNWMFRQLLRIKESTPDDQFWQEIMGKKTVTGFVKESFGYLQGYLFGRGTIRGITNLLILLLAGYRLASLARKESAYRYLIGLFLATLGLTGVSLFRADQGLSMRLYCTLFPFLALFAAFGFSQMAGIAKRCLPRLPVAEKLALLCGAVVTAAMFAQPSCWAAWAEGFQPYLRISTLANETLPPDAIVQCDRWLTPWNELRVNAPGDVNYTFLFPNAPPSVYESSQWRSSLIKYLRNDPFTGYLEQKHYWERIGPWEAPHSLFSRKLVFLDEATWKLNRIGLAYRGNSDLNTPRDEVAVTLYYNTDEDVVARAKAEGKHVLRGYGEGWRYLKPWQPMQGWPEQLMQMLWIQAGMYADGGKTVASLADLQKMPQQQAVQYLNQGRWADYRIPGERSTLRLFNLTEAELQATLTVTGIALSGNVRCMIGDQAVVFPQTLLAERRIPVILKPGENEMVVSLPANQFMLVHDVRLNPADGAP